MCGCIYIAFDRDCQSIKASFKFSCVFPPKFSSHYKTFGLLLHLLAMAMSDDDDFQEIPFTQATQPRLKPSDFTRRPPKRQKADAAAAPDKENLAPSRKRGDCSEKEILKSKGSYLCNSIESRLLNARSGGDGDIARGFSEESEGSYLCNSVESRLLEPRSDGDGDGNGGFHEESDEDFEQLDVLIRLCSEGEEEPASDGFGFCEQRGSGSEGGALVQCPLCEIDISDLSDELRQVHTNGCLDRVETENVKLIDPLDRVETENVKLLDHFHSLICKVFQLSLFHSFRMHLKLSILILYIILFVSDISGIPVARVPK